MADFAINTVGFTKADGNFFAYEFEIYFLFY